MNPSDKKGGPDAQQPEILTNLDQTPDPTVVVSEPDRSVVLREEDTLVIEKPQKIEVIPSNRPRKVYRGMWGPMEVAALSVSLLTLLGLVVLYVFFVVPSNTEVAQMKAERDRLEQELISARSKYGDITSTETQVAKLVTSVADFESAYLPIAATGRTSLYQRLNGLIAGYGLVNTNGPNYAPLMLNEQQNGNGNGNSEGEQQSDQERGRAKFRSIFPGVYVTMTLEGPYANLRRFIRDVETGSEFVIISSVELEPTEAKQKERDPSLPPIDSPATTGPPFASNTMRGNIDPRTGRPVFPTPQPQVVARPQGKTHGEIVSLRLEMAAYFRRENFAPPVQEP
jgi:hypothetical protein